MKFNEHDRNLKRDQDRDFQDREKEAQAGPMSLHEHCHIESGGLTGAALERYVQRYYGHG